MDAKIGGYDVLEIAEKIERNGVKFYRRAAGLCSDDRISTLFVQLAQWEARHVELFGQMRERLTAEGRQPGHVDPDRIDGIDAQALAGLAVFGIQPDPSRELTGSESRTDVLRMAIEKEKDSIVYYTGLKGFLAHQTDRQVVEEVIQEEMKHVRILVQALEQTV